MTKSNKETKKEEVVESPQAPEATPEGLKEVVQDSSSKGKSDRKSRWNKLWDAYKIQNPAKYELRKAGGKMDKVPDSFK